jgi:CxxC motif-containing protein (DUF1111 family)
MRHLLFALMASAGLLACSGGGESDPATDGQSASNNIPSAGSTAIEEREFANSTSSSALTPPPTTARDPGPRTTSPGSGAPLAGLTPAQMALFVAGKEDFNDAEDVADGLGPTMNLDSCGGCHAQPAAGGSSPTVNPQVALATKNGMTNRVPSFIRANGPVREARFVRNADGTPDGGVHALFTIKGHPAVPNCNIAQPDFASQLSARNVIFRIPTPVFGAGLIESIADSEILKNQAAQAQAKQQLGIRGRPNVVLAFNSISGQVNKNGNDGTIARFGHKAQNKSLLIFSGEAYNVEMGISNELFPTEREENPACQFATSPNDVFDTVTADPVEAMSAADKFATFMRLLAPPAPSATEPGGGASIGRGKLVFAAAGCALCHTPSMRTGNATVVALRNQTANLYSDLLVHDMGVGLADGVSQGQAGPREFRTAPLWGLGQRVFFLHDGRTNDLVVAIRSHASSGSEANTVIGNFQQLREDQKQDLLNFLRSL